MAEVRTQIATKQEQTVSKLRFEAGNSHIRSRSTGKSKTIFQPHLTTISGLKTSTAHPVAHDPVLSGPLGF
jgi:hypothetical protein